MVPAQAHTDAGQATIAQTNRTVNLPNLRQLVQTCDFEGHVTWVLGVDTVEQALEKLEAYRLDGVVQRMRCPFLITHGADDEQVPLADAEALYSAAGSKDKTLRVFTAEEGGAQHCMRDYLSLGVAEMWNWLEDRLVRV